MLVPPQTARREHQGKQRSMPEHRFEVSALLADLYRVVDRLEALFPGRKFTPDGHLIGSIGEVVAAQMFGLTLLPPSTAKHDAKATDGRFVQIKLTQGDRIALRAEPQQLLVLTLNRDLDLEVVYNGRGCEVWSAAGRKQSNGQRQVSLSKLRTIDKAVPEQDRLPLAHHFSKIAS